MNYQDLMELEVDELSQYKKSLDNLVLGIYQTNIIFLEQMKILTCMDEDRIELMNNSETLKTYAEQLTIILNDYQTKRPSPKFFLCIF